MNQVIRFGITFVSRWFCSFNTFRPIINECQLLGSGFFFFMEAKDSLRASSIHKFFYLKIFLKQEVEFETTSVPQDNPLDTGLQNGTTDVKRSIRNMLSPMVLGCCCVQKNHWTGTLNLCWAKNLVLIQLDFYH